MGQEGGSESREKGERQDRGRVLVAEVGCERGGEAGARAILCWDWGVWGWGFGVNRRGWFLCLLTVDIFSLYVFCIYGLVGGVFWNLGGKFMYVFLFCAGGLVCFVLFFV